MRKSTRKNDKNYRILKIYGRLQDFYYHSGNETNLPPVDLERGKCENYLDGVDT